MITASLIEDVTYSYVPQDDFGGLARVYALSSPVDLDGDGTTDDHVVVRILYRRDTMHAEIALFPSDETGLLKANGIPGVARRMGSFPLVPCPKGNPHAIEFAIAVALKFYDITLEANSGNDS